MITTNICVINLMTSPDGMAVGRWFLFMEVYLFGPFDCTTGAGSEKVGPLVIR